MTAVLAIDPGTKCGWALRRDGDLTSGVWDLLPTRKTKHHTRWLNLWSCLDEIGPVSCVAYELVMAHPSAGAKLGRKGPGFNTRAAHVYGGIVAVIEMWADHRKVLVMGEHVGRIKKHATERGNATKLSMLEAARKRWPDQSVATHDQADALWLLDLVMRGWSDSGSALTEEE